MRIVLDLHSLQTESRFRGIGRYSLALARAMITEGKNHEFFIILNHNFPDTIDWVKKTFSDLLPSENILTFKVPRAAFGLDNDSQRQYKSAELVREYFIDQLMADWVHVFSFFESMTTDAIVSVGCFTKTPTSITIHDFIPSYYSKYYLNSDVAKLKYSHLLSHLKRATLLLTVSEYTKKETEVILGICSEKVINISADASPNFKSIKLDEKPVLKTKNKYRILKKFIMYTGGLDFHKNIEGLIEAFAAISAEVRQDYQLLICGNIGTQATQHLAILIKKFGLSTEDIVLTGYVEDDELVELYNYCDLFVFPSLSEGFGLPVLEAMRCGAPVIGSNTSSLPEVIGLEEALFDPHSIASISQKLYQALTDHQFRQRLINHGKIQARKFSWKNSAQRALQSIEAAYNNFNDNNSISIKTEEDLLNTAHLMTNDDLDLKGFPYASDIIIKKIVSLSHTSKPSDKELLELAEAINENHIFAPQYQIFVDISVLVKFDSHTGIQRVTRSILKQLIETPPAGFRIEPVYRSNGIYRYARQFKESFTGVKNLSVIDSPVDVFPKDIFLGLDLDAEVDRVSSDWLRYHSRRGLKIYYIVHDLIPLNHPEWFFHDINLIFKSWFNHISGIGDGLLCVSRSTAEDVGKWLNSHPVQRIKPLRIEYFHHGADIEASKPTEGISSQEKAVINQISNQTNILMVGTIEPRKGHLQALDAFEQIWKRGNQVNLIIVGKQGWNVKDLIKRLKSSPKKGKHLFWFDNASDELLLKIYQNVSVLLMASEGEGFGLPLIEAAKHGLPIIARDLPIFREVAGNNAFYFDGKDAGSLAVSLKEWLDLFKQNKHPGSQGIKWLTWAESAGQLQNALFRPVSRASWDPKNGFRWNSEFSSNENTVFGQ